MLVRTMVVFDPSNKAQTLDICSGQALEIVCLDDLSAEDDPIVVQASTPQWGQPVTDDHS